MKRDLKVWLVIGSLLLSIGCHRVTYVAPTKVPSTVKQEVGMPFFLWGLAGEGQIDTQMLCGPAGAASIVTMFGPLDVVLAIVTIGLYWPRTAELTCAAQ